LIHETAHTKTGKTMTLLRDPTQLIGGALALILLAAAWLCIGCAHDGKVETAAAPPAAAESRAVASGKFRSVVLADLDQDGNIDLVAGGAAPAKLSIGYGDGNGRISDVHYLPVSGDVQSAAVGDVNGDRLLDVVFSIQQESSGILVWIQHPDRRWSQGSGPTAMNLYQGIAVADFNHDGFADVAAANATSASAGGVQVWFGDGRGNWPAQNGPTQIGMFMDVTTADFNHDGHPDLVASGWGIGGELRMWYGDGAGSWSAAPPLRSGSYYGVHAADIDGDGHQDILAGTYRSGVEVLFGHGDGRFAPVRKPRDWGSFWDVRVTDLDADGRVEILATSNDGNGISAWHLSDRKHWQIIGDRFPDTGTYFELAVGDLNRDGFEDVCAASFGEGVKFWHGRSETAYTGLTDVITGADRAGRGIAAPEVEENDVYTSASGFPEYKVGPGDILEITLWQAAEPQKEEVLVRPDGRISFGFVEDLTVRGLTPTQLDARLSELYREYVRNPRIDVMVKVYNSKFAALTGAVGGGIRTSSSGAGSGKYPLDGKVRLLELLARAGGPNRDANLREVRVRRKNGETFALNLYRAIYQGDPSQNIILNDGDWIYFTTLILDANRVFVFGEVASPGVIKLAESNMQLFDAIAEAGGPTVFAVKRQTKIVRGSVTRPEIIDVDLKKLLEEGDQTQNVALNSGDFIYVPRGFMGDVNIFWKRVKPLFEMVIAPARTVNEWDEALDTLER
jgi:polysaccharide export outer membrane protein